MKKKRVDWDTIEIEALLLAKALDIKIFHFEDIDEGAYGRDRITGRPVIKYGHSDEALNVVRLLHELGHAWNEHDIGDKKLTMENEAWDWAEEYIQGLGYEVPEIMRSERIRCIATYEAEVEHVKETNRLLDSMKVS